MMSRFRHVACALGILVLCSAPRAEGASSSIQARLASPWATCISQCPTGTPDVASGTPSVERA